MKPEIVMFLNFKGGTGKTTATFTYLDVMEQLGRQVCLVDSDTSNPEVGRAYKDQITTDFISLDDETGWSELTTLCNDEDKKDNMIVVNGAARNNEGVKEWMNILLTSLAELERRLIIFWVINRQRPSVQMLKNLHDIVKESEQSELITIHVVRNLYFGEAEKFERFNKSEIGKTIQKKGGKVIDLPELNDLIMDDLLDKSLSIKAYFEHEAKIGPQAVIKNWRSKVHKAFKGVLNE